MVIMIVIFSLVGILVIEMELIMVIRMADEIMVVRMANEIEVIIIIIAMVLKLGHEDTIKVVMQIMEQL